MLGISTALVGGLTCDWQLVSANAKSRNMPISERLVTWKKLCSTVREFDVHSEASLIWSHLG